MKYVIGFVAIAVVLAILFAIANRPVRVRIDADVPADFPSTGFSHAEFAALLEKYVESNGTVNYSAWHASDSSRARLDSYLSAVARFSPESTPERFADDDARLAYWMYAYNAYVIRSVVNNWPIKSVTDLKAPLEFIKGLGFFYRLRFNFGGTYYSLLSVENNIIRKRFQDPRIHFVLNCASESCPIARPDLPTGDALEPHLQAAAVEFVSDPKNVYVDHANQTVVLSTIFKWFKRDFVNDLARRGIPSQRGLIDYVAGIAPEHLQKELDKAVGYEIEFRDYDWTLNNSD